MSSVRAARIREGKTHPDWLAIHCSEL